jgi:integrase
MQTTGTGDLIPLPEFLSMALESYTNVTPKSIRRFRRFVTTFGKKWRHLKVGQIIPAHVEDYLLDFPEWKQSTKEKAQDILKQAFKWGVETNLLDKSPLDGLKIKRKFVQPKGKECLVGEEEYVKLLTAAGAEGKRMLQFMFESGCRPGELRRARKEHYRPSDKALLMPDTKSQKPRDRFIRLTQPLIEMVEMLIGRGRDYLFIDPRYRHERPQRPWTLSAMGKWFRPLRKKAGVDRPDLTLYSFRHTFCTDGLKAGLSPEQVAILAGNHAATIWKFYSHLADLTQHHFTNLMKFRG